MIDVTKIPHDRVGLGSRVVVLDVKKNEEITYNLVTSEEADATHDVHDPGRRRHPGYKHGRAASTDDAHTRTGEHEPASTTRRARVDETLVT